MPADFNNENNLPNSHFDGSFINAEKVIAGQIGDVYNNYYPEKPINPIKRIPHQGTPHFVGRDKELVKIHEILYQQQNTAAISALGGMGGVGKTELAVKYARTHEDDYPGGICWFNLRSGDIATEILTFAITYLGLEIPQKGYQEQPLTLEEQIKWCWDNWRPQERLVLVVLDDVTNLENFTDYLPENNRFRVLITTRLRNLDDNIIEIPLDVLSPDNALQLLINIVGDKKVNKKLQIAQELCRWLGYLPLCIELVGRYISKKPPHFTLTKMLELLKKQRLQQEAINPNQKSLSTAKLGVKAAIELSWLELDESTQNFAGLLSLFAQDIFAWELVESITQSLNWDENVVNTAIEQLHQRHLVDCVEESDIFYYKTHPLIREFLQEKLSAMLEADSFKQAFVTTFIEIAQSIPTSATLEQINSVKNAIPHLAEVAQNLIDVVNDEDLDWAFIGLGRFYNEQGLYRLAEPWLQQFVSTVELRLGDNHPYFATSLNNLALLYYSQGRHDDAEPLYIQAFELYKRILGDNHPDVAQSLNNLAELYRSQGRYDDAEPLYLQAFELRKRILGDNHPNVAQSLNNLAALY